MPMNRFIIIVLCNCLLEQKTYKQKLHLFCLLYLPAQLLLLVLFISSCGCDLLSRFFLRSPLFLKGPHVGMGCDFDIQPSM